jgi:hypothetical protein
MYDFPPFRIKKSLQAGNLKGLVLLSGQLLQVAPPPLPGVHPAWTFVAPPDPGIVAEIPYGCSVHHQCQKSHYDSSIHGFKCECFL